MDYEKCSPVKRRSTNNEGYMDVAPALTQLISHETPRLIGNSDKSTDPDLALLSPLSSLVQSSLRTAAVRSEVWR